MIKTTKRLTVRLICTLSIILALAACSPNSQESRVRQFASDFGTWLSTGDIHNIGRHYHGASTLGQFYFSYDPSQVEIFQDDDNHYTIKYGNGVEIKIRCGFDNAVEVIRLTGLGNSGAMATPAVAQMTADSTAAAAQTATVDQSTVDEFAKRFKRNIVAGKWDIDYGIQDEESLSGKCGMRVTNKNPFAVDGSDYYITYKYEYLYAEGMYSENCRQSGKNIPSNGSVVFKHGYTDDCGPTKVTVKFRLDNRRIYDKYVSR